MADDPDAKDSAKDSHDIVLLHSRTDDGEGVRALRSRSGRLESAELRPLRQGRPLARGEVVQLLPRKESPLLWDVDVKYSSEAAEEGQQPRSGPARYSSKAFRENWSSVFGKGKTKGKKSNKKVLLN